MLSNLLLSSATYLMAISSEEIRSEKKKQNKEQTFVWRTLRPVFCIWTIKRTTFWFISLCHHHHHRYHWKYNLCMAKKRKKQKKKMWNIIFNRIEFEICFTRFPQFKLNVCAVDSCCTFLFTEHVRIYIH